MTKSKQTKKGYEIIGRAGYKFRVGFLSWTIAKIWQVRNAKTPELSDKEKQRIAEKFNKPMKVVEHAIHDNWPRYWRGGKKPHAVMRPGRAVTVEGV